SSFRRSVRRATSAREHPSRASDSAAASPIPLEAPVTRATLPARGRPSGPAGAGGGSLVCMAYVYLRGPPVYPGGRPPHAVGPYAREEPVYAAAAAAAYTVAGSLQAGSLQAGS